MDVLAFQKYVRIVLYTGFGAAGMAGFLIPENTKTLVASIVGFLANFVWTLWGSKISNLIAELQSKSGVEAVAVKVDAEQIDPKALAAATPAAVTITAAK